MIGLCAILGPDGASDPVKYFGRAFDHYGRAPGRGARMLATRAMLACAMYQTAAGRWAGGPVFGGRSLRGRRLADAATVRWAPSWPAVRFTASLCAPPPRHAAAVGSLMRAHYDEENARAALLLEQAAYAQVTRSVGVGRGPPGCWPCRGRAACVHALEPKAPCQPASPAPNAPHPSLCTSLLPVPSPPPPPAAAPVAAGAPQVWLPARPRGAALPRGAAAAPRGALLPAGGPPGLRLRPCGVALFPAALPPEACSGQRCIQVQQPTLTPITPPPTPPPRVPPKSPQRSPGCTPAARGASYLSTLPTSHQSRRQNLGTSPAPRPTRAHCWRARRAAPPRRRRTTWRSSWRRRRARRRRRWVPRRRLRRRGGQRRG
jgi:hypothetical protein